MRRAPFILPAIALTVALAGCIAVTPPPSETTAPATDEPVEILVTGDPCPDVVEQAYAAAPQPEEGAPVGVTMLAEQRVGIEPSCAFDLSLSSQPGTTTVAFVFADDLDAAWERVDQAFGDASFTLQSKKLQNEATWVHGPVLVSGAVYDDGDGPLQDSPDPYIYLQWTTAS